MNGPRRALVFGGSGALGGVVCRTLAREGARVAFTYRTGEAKARKLAAELPESRAYPLDFSAVKDIERTVEEAASFLGGIDAFVHCAGVAVTMECTGPTSHHRMPEVDEAGWDRIIGVNAKSAFFAVRRLIPIMKEGGGGDVVLIGSIDGVKSVPSPVHYAASKAGLSGMTRAMSKELGEIKVRVNMVAPGIMEDGISRALPENLLKEYVKHCGLKRVGTLQEIANVAVWLAMKNTYVTGQCIVIDGAL